MIYTPIPDEARPRLARLAEAHIGKEHWWMAFADILFLHAIIHADEMMPKIIATMKYADAEDIPNYRDMLMDMLSTSIKSKEGRRKTSK